jgi:oligopeptide transport system substrate-binding protein
MSKAREETDEKKRMNLLSEAEELLFKYMPICPLYYVHNSYAVKPKVKGLVRGSSAIQDMDFYWTYLE